MEKVNAQFMIEGEVGGANKEKEEVHQQESQPQSGNKVTSDNRRMTALHLEAACQVI